MRLFYLWKHNTGKWVRWQSTGEKIHDYLGMTLNFPNVASSQSAWKNMWTRCSRVYLRTWMERPHLWQQNISFGSGTMQSNSPMRKQRCFIEWQHSCYLHANKEDQIYRQLSPFSAQVWSPQIRLTTKNWQEKLNTSIEQHSCASQWKQNISTKTNGSLTGPLLQKHKNLFWIIHDIWQGNDGWIIEQTEDQYNKFHRIQDSYRTWQYVINLIDKILSWRTRLSNETKHCAARQSKHNASGNKQTMIQQ